MHINFGDRMRLMGFLKETLDVMAGVVEARTAGDFIKVGSAPTGHFVIKTTVAGADDLWLTLPCDVDAIFGAQAAQIRAGFIDRRRPVQTDPGPMTAQARCSQCAAVLAKIRSCTLCRSAMYCDKDCQKLHWKDGGHKKTCARNAAPITTKEALRRR